MEAAALGSCCELCRASSLVSRIRGTSFCRGMLLCGGVFRPPSVKGVPDVSSKATHCAGTVISPAPKSAKSDEPRTGDLPDETGLGWTGGADGLAERGDAASAEDGRRFEPRVRRWEGGGKVAVAAGFGVKKLYW